MYNPVRTADGSATLYSQSFDEHYHSTRDGAFSESLHKHVIPAWSLLCGAKEEVRILDICFGLGYNTLATLYYLKSRNIATKVHIIAPEMDESLVRSLVRFEYPKEFEELGEVIRQISQTLRYEDQQFCIEVAIGDARAILPTLPCCFDIVYQDPFSPRKNPLLWTHEYFAAIKRVAADKMILTTYSSATPVRMGLYENGFLIYEPQASSVRSGTIASLSPLLLVPVDMERKKERNPLARPLFDSDYFPGGPNLLKKGE